MVDNPGSEVVLTSLNSSSEFQMIFASRARRNLDAALDTPMNAAMDDTRWTGSAAVSDSGEEDVRGGERFM